MGERNRGRLLRTIGLPVAAVAAAALLLGCSAPASAPAAGRTAAAKPHLTVFTLPPGVLGSGTGSASSRETLMAAAAAAARGPDAAVGRYWVAPGMAGNVVEVGSAALHYLVVEKVTTQNWSAASGDASVTVAQPLGVQFATTADQAAWRRAGSPAQWSTVAQNDGLADPQGNANTGRLAPLSAVPQTPQVSQGNAGSPPFSVGGQVLSLSGLRALPASPAALKAILMNVYNAGFGDTQAYLLQVIPPILQMPVTQAVRSGLYQILAGLPGLRSLGTVMDVAGQRGVAVSYSASYPACGGVLDLGGSGAAGFQTTFPSCTVQQILVIDPATGRPLAEELRYAGLPAGSRWPVPGGLFSYEIYGAAHWTNASLPG